MNQTNSYITTTINYLKKYYWLIVTGSYSNRVGKAFPVVLLLCLVLPHGTKAQGKINENGYNIFYHPNGAVLSEGNLRNGKPDGYWKTYYPNGQLKSEGNRKNYALDSTWKFYNEAGFLVNEINYAGDKKNGITRIYNEKGKLLTEEHFIDNVKHGKSISYFPNGKIKDEYNYENNILSGKATVYDSTGNIITLEEYIGGRVTTHQEINRYNNEGKKTGKWIELYANGTLKSETEFVNGIKDGITREYDTQGNLTSMRQYDLGQENDTLQFLIFLDIRREYFPNGKVKIAGTYDKDKKHGVFREFNPDGSIKQCYIYKQGKLVSAGMIDSSGTYNGPWKDYFDTGEVKDEGEYENGVKINQWKYFFKNGKIEQEGIYVLGKPHKNWKWYYRNGQVRRNETFRYGKEEGEVVEYDSSGNIITNGNYIGGMREGDWYYDLGDHIEKGKYVGDVRDGEWVYEYKLENNRVAFKGKYVNGLAEGKHKYYYPNGRLAISGKYKSGMKEGRWTRYNEKGEIMFSITYRHGVEIQYDGQRIKTDLIPGEVNSVFD